MSLIYCPECGHEISAQAVACPNCGRPINVQPVVERKVMVAQPPVRTVKSDGFPTVALVPIGILALLLTGVLFFLFRGSSDDQGNMNVRVNMAGHSNSLTRSTTVPASTPDEVHSTTTTVPGTTTSAPSAPLQDKGGVVINASITTPNGTPQAAKNVKFYLLDKDLETILSEARIQPIESNTLSGSLGLALVFPERYGDFQRAAMRAIAPHAKYSGTTDARGSANLSGVDPKEYYLFSITRIGRGFALWDSPVSIVPGQNALNLTPQSVTEIPDTSE